MNFLAHLYLSGSDEEIKVGNFIGDFVKGNPRDQYDGKIVDGIIIHREIDRYTDLHPVSQRSKKRLVEKYRHYSGVIIDIFYDHFLANHWSDFSDIPLADFADESYAIMNKHIDIFPEKARFMLPYMERYNWLVNYAKINGIQRTLQGMSQRTSFRSKMEEATADLEENYEDFERDFFDFFPEIRGHISEFNPQ